MKTFESTIRFRVPDDADVDEAHRLIHGVFNSDPSWPSGLERDIEIVEVHEHVYQEASASAATVAPAPPPADDTDDD